MYVSRKLEGLVCLFYDVWELCKNRNVTVSCQPQRRERKNTCVEISVDTCVEFDRVAVKQQLCCLTSRCLCSLLISHPEAGAAGKPSPCQDVFLRCLSLLYSRYCVLVSELGCQRKRKQAASKTSLIIRAGNHLLRVRGQEIRERLRCHF